MSEAKYYGEEWPFEGITNKNNYWSLQGYARIIKCEIFLGNIVSAQINLAQLSAIDPDDEQIIIEREKLDQLQGHLETESIAASNKNYETALNCIEKCLLISPECSAYVIKKGEYLALLNRHNEAQQVLNEILEIDAINVDAKYILGLRVYHNDVEEALQYFKDILRLDPDHVKCLQIYKVHFLCPPFNQLVTRYFK